MFNKILVAYDGTPSAESAFEQAARLARAERQALHVVAVAWTPEVETRVAMDMQVKALLEQLRSRESNMDLDLRTEVAEGNPHEQIVRVAKRLDADLLVIGHRRRGLMQRLAETSVAKRVIDRAHCPVMVAN
jgi:nucleotide-binding universal stress UspA family protein